MFQYPEHQLFATTVYDDVAFGPRNLGFSADEVDARVRTALEQVGLPFDELAERSPFELSGGQQRCCAFAGVLAMQPEVLVLDEPAVGLDPAARREFLQLIAGLHERGLTVAIDSTGLSPDRPSGWMVEKWNHSRVRGWYKLHVAVDVDAGTILSYVVTEPYYNDSLAFERLMDIVLDAGHDVACVLADAAYDKKVNWNRMHGLGIEFIANINGVFDPTKRGFGCGRFRGCAVRAKHVLRILEVGREKWKEEVGYSRRWRVEGTFSDLKRMFGDTLRARARERVAELIGRIVRCHNIFKSIRWSL